MNKLRSYFVFTSSIYRLLILVILPLAVIGIDIIAIETVGYGMVAFGIMLLILIDIFSDYWVFGGISAKSFSGLACAQASTKGERLFANALIADMLRRAIWYTLLAGILVLIEIATINYPLETMYEIAWFYVLVMGSCYVLATVTLIFTRYMSNYAGGLFLSYIAGMIEMVIFALLGIIGVTGVYAIIILVVEIILGVIFSVLLYWNNKKKVRGSYYDKAD